MSEHKFWIGAAVGFAIATAAFFLLACGTDIQEGYTKRQCDVFGQTTLNNVKYTCFVLNGSERT